MSLKRKGAEDVPPGWELRVSRHKDHHEYYYCERDDVSLYCDRTLPPGWAWGRRPAGEGAPAGTNSYGPKFWQHLRV